MARLKVGDDVVRVRFRDGTFDRIDAVYENRSEFIRCAVDAALGSDPVRAVPVPVEPAVDTPAPQKKNSIVAVPKGSRSGAVSLRDGDMASIMEIVGSGRFTSRDIADRLGLAGLRYSRAEAALLKGGRIRFDGGVVCASDPS